MPPWPHRPDARAGRVRILDVTGVFGVIGAVAWRMRYDLLAVLAVAAAMAVLVDILPLQSAAPVVPLLGIVVSIFIGFRNSNAYYFLPNADEWYKAAYYHPTGGNYFLYPTGSNTAPTPVTGGTANNTAVYSLLTKNGPADIDNAGGPSAYDTYAQGGNVYEWDETDVDLVNDDPDAARGVRGGRWSFSTDYNLSSVNRYADSPALEAGNVGFRVAAVPEPSSGLLALTGLLALLRRRR